MTCLQPGDSAPQFRSLAVQNGEIVEFTLDDALRGYQYLLLVFYPADFTFVCPTEIVQFVEKWSDFSSLQCSVVCCSTDSAYTHSAWLKAAKSERGLGSPDKGAIILLSDRSHAISEAYGVLAEDNGAAYRATFLIDADKRIAQVTVNDMPVGRSVEEALRMVKELRDANGVGSVGGVGSGGGQRGRSTSSCAKMRLPVPQQAPPQPSTPSLPSYQPQYQQQYQSQCQQQYQQQYQQPCQQQYYQQQQQPATPSPSPQAGAGPIVYQCEPQSFSVGQPVCSSLAVEAASLETQAAQLRVKDSEDRLAWMLTETDRLRLEADRLRADTERLKAEAHKRQSEAERLASCHSACQAAGPAGGGVAAAAAGATNRSAYGDDCSWSTAPVGCGHRLPQTQQQQHHCPTQQPPPPPPQPLPHHYCQPQTPSWQQPQPPQPSSTRRAQSHVCRRGVNSVASHFAGGGPRC